MKIEKNKLAKRGVVLWLVIFMLILFSGIIYALQTRDTGYKVDNGQTVVINEWGICKWVKRTQTPSVFVPTKTQSEWETFINNSPTGVALNDCGACGTETQVLINGNSYDTVNIGDQCWLARNVNEGAAILVSTPQTDNNSLEKYCMGGKAIACNAWGGLYQFNEAVNYVSTTSRICPVGWHIPTDNDWHILENHLALLAHNSCDPNRNQSWDCDPSGIELEVGGSTGFNVPLVNIKRGDYPTGEPLTGFEPADFSSGAARYWSSTDTGTGAGVYYRAFNADGVEPGVYRHADPLKMGYFVRCVKD